MQAFRPRAQSQTPVPGSGVGSGSRVIHGSDQFRSPAGGVPGSQTARLRRGIAGSTTQQVLPQPVETRQAVCAGCGQSFVIAIRPGMTTIPCVRCGVLHDVTGGSATG
jgi:hypothetical protein